MTLRCRLMEASCLAREHVMGIWLLSRSRRTLGRVRTWCGRSPDDLSADGVGDAPVAVLKLGTGICCRAASELQCCLHALAKPRLSPGSLLFYD
eukprot:363423-Chlamydomonas_euryale.AAC.5